MLTGGIHSSMVDKELISLVELACDEDDSVRQCVMDRLMERGQEAVDSLLELRPSGSTVAAPDRIRDLRHRLVRELILEQLRNVPSSVEVSLPYIYSRISTLVMPELDTDLFASQINCMVSEFLKEINEKQTAVEQMEIFNHIFFNRHHFKLNDYPPEKISTAFLPSVIDSRKGTPVAILLLYFMMAREAGMDVRPVCVRRGMVPVVMENDRVLFFVDLNRDGALVSDSVFFHSIFCDREVDDCVLDFPGVNILPVIYAKSLLLPYGGGISSEYLESAIEILSKNLNR